MESHSCNGYGQVTNRCGQVRRVALSNDLTRIAHRPNCSLLRGAGRIAASSKRRRVGHLVRIGRWKCLVECGQAAGVAGGHTWVGGGDHGGSKGFAHAARVVLLRDAPPTGRDGRFRFDAESLFQVAPGTGNGR
jgi:hypothetical protein